MADRTIARRLFESLIESNPSLLDAELTAKQTVNRSSHNEQVLLTTANSVGIPLVNLSTTEFTSTARVVGVKFTSPIVQAASGAVFYNCTLWSRDSAGANKTTICTFGMGAAGATAVAVHVPAASPDLVPSAAASVVPVGGLIGVDVAITGAPTAATGCVTIVLEGE